VFLPPPVQVRVQWLLPWPAQLCLSRVLLVPIAVSVEVSVAEFFAVSVAVSCIVMFE